MTPSAKKSPELLDGLAENTPQTFAVVTDGCLIVQCDSNLRAFLRLSPAPAAGQKFQTYSISPTSDSAEGFLMTELHPVFSSSRHHRLVFVVWSEMSQQLLHISVGWVETVGRANVQFDTGVCGLCEN